MESDQSHHSVEQALQDCEEKVKILEEENQDLRESSHAFGLLAERLNNELQQDRRVGSERRQTGRPNVDRRSQRTFTTNTPAQSSNDAD